MTESKPCQYIKGEKLDDANKCGKDCDGRSPYCEAHHVSTHKLKSAPGENDAHEYEDFSL